MKNRSSRSMVCALGLTAALLGGCAPTGSAAASATPADASTTMAQTTPVAAQAATPQVSSTAVASASPTSGASASVPILEGVSITVAKAGSGEPIAKGSAGKFHYTGWLDGFESAKQFDSSRGKEPFSVQLGKAQVIPGWDQGLVGMQPGEIRRLTISPEMGYGADGMAPVIPPNSTLYFEVEYLGPAE